MSTRAPGKRPALQSTNARKSVQKVSTDLDHYDRSDPFAAMNALRMLLSSLSSKPATRQHEMTPEEHNLSIHLLMIVRRFIGAMRPVGDNSQLPTELFDHIVFHVDSKRDLLSLALTCQRMCSIVSSDHFGYRVVKTKVSLIRVWHHLITRPDLACNIRRLEIIDENERSSESRLILPKIADTSTDAKGTDDKLKFPAKLEKLFVSAVAGMHYLKSFKWSCTTSLISIASLWPTLLKCYQLRLIDLNDNTMFLHPKDGSDLAKKDTATPMELVTTVSVKSIKSSYGTTKDPQLTCIADLVMCFPNLKNLDITYAVPRDPDFFRPIADDFYSCGRWQNLTSLTLNNLWCTSQGLHSLATFLSEHNNLETLHFDSEGIKIAPLATLLLHNTLPRLKELKSNRKFANAILSCTSDVPRPLKTLKGIELSGSESDRTFFDNLTRVGGEISRVELAGWKETDDLRELLNCVPKLTWLDVGYAPNKAANAYNADHWATLLTRVPEITTFFGVKLFKQAPDEKNLRLLAWKCPKLRRLEHWEDGRSKVIILSREDGKVKHQVKLMILENKDGLSTW